MGKLYNIIYQLCKERGTNITALCKETSISRATLSELKMGRTRQLSSVNLAKVAGFFSVSTDYLLGIKSSPNDDPVFEKEELKIIFNTLKNASKEKLDRILKIIEAEIEQ